MCDKSRSRAAEQRLTNVGEVVQERPRAREEHADATSGHRDAGSHFIDFKPGLARKRLNCRLFSPKQTKNENVEIFFVRSAWCRL
jgi:hypothetical protein